jgi:uncharacterized protein (DUF1786 family)
MQILSVDIGTGTQDIYLYRSGSSLENGLKLVLPSPTMMIRDRIRAATKRGDTLLLRGVTMGGGPCQWAAEAHIRAGHKIFATPDAARTFNDDLEWVHREMGVEIVSEDETSRLDGVQSITMRDFDYETIANTFSHFGVDLNLNAVAVAVFDHGAAPRGISDRQFRFDYLQSRIEVENKLSSFAHLAENVPSIMSRMQAVVKSAEELDCPMVVMDTAPAAVIGTTLDPRVATQSRVIAVNIGNFHTLAFHLGPSGVEGFFEHHTGEIDLPRLESLIESLADGSLTTQDVFDDKGHGAMIIHPMPLSLNEGDFGVAVTGPRRMKMQGSRLRPLIPDLADPIHADLKGERADTPPWDVEG